MNSFEEPLKSCFLDTNTPTKTENDDNLKKKILKQLVAFLQIDSFFFFNHSWQMMTSKW